MALNNKSEKFLKALLVTILSLAFWIGLWAFAAWRVGVPFILPTPASVFLDFFSLFKTSELYLTLLKSMGSLAAGFAAGVLFGVLFAVPSALSKLFDSLVSPIFTVIRATPVASFIIIAWVLLNNRVLPGFICLLMTAPIVWRSVSEGIKSLDRSLYEVTKVYRFGFWKTIRLYLFPMLSPFLSSGLSTALGLAWKATIATEILVHTPDSLGYMIWDAKAWNPDTSLLFAWTLVVIFVSILLDALIVFAFGKKRAGIRKERRGDRG